MHLLIGLGLLILFSPLRGRASKPFIRHPELPFRIRGGDEGSNSLWSPITAKSSSALNHRRASNLVLDLISRSGVDHDAESQKLRHLISERTSETLRDIIDNTSDPFKLLHFLAPKIPAIRYSPDVALRIQASRNDMDCGLAACVVASLALVWEAYSSNQPRHDKDELEKKEKSILQERRFEQLIECIWCGVGPVTIGSDSDDEALSDADLDYTSLSVRDACRAAWGLAVILVSSGLDRESFVHLDLIHALAWRVEKQLRYRQQQLHQGDMIQDGISTTIEEGVRFFSEELAEDAASVLWAFACVKACTGINNTGLVEVCTGILCQDPYEMRRTAQEQDYSISNKNMEVGANDVVERLAVSENEESKKQENSTTHSDSPFDDPAKPQAAYLLDWLSFDELTDTIWALAIHGSGVEQHISTTYTEMACAKMLSHLSSYLDELRTLSRVTSDFTELNKESNKLAPENHKVLDQDDTSVSAKKQLGKGSEQVHLSSSQSLEPNNVQSLSEPASSQENGPIDEVSNCTEESEADAASSLRDQDIPVEQDTVDALEDREKNLQDGAEDKFDLDELGILGKDGDFDDEVDENYSEDEDSMNETDFVPRTQTFISKDSCSLAWAVTELDVPERESLVEKITCIFRYLGKPSLQGLSGRDLSNLCWAIARNKASVEDEATDIVVKWIADCALELRDNDISSEESSLLNLLDPQDLSRFVWSLSTILTDRGSVRWTSVSIVSLIYRTLITASLNLNMFGTEDMARIIWAFVSLTDTSESFTWPSVAPAIGKLLATIEASLLEWEKGGTTLKVNAESANTERSDISRVASFFGLPHFTRLVLDHEVEEATGDHEMEDKHRKSQLPLIRDLPIDPLTLCKLFSALCKLTNYYEGILWENPALVRLPVRLFASNNGRLMRDCPWPDLVRLVEAVALASDVGQNRDQIGSFARKLSAFVNELPSYDNGMVNLGLSNAEYSALLWSLGKLGIRFSPTDDKTTAHRKHRIVLKPHLSTQSLSSISISKIIRLLNGLIFTELAFRVENKALDVMLHVGSRMSAIVKEQDACMLLETLGYLRYIHEKSYYSTSQAGSKSSGSFTVASDEGAPSASAGKEHFHVREEVMEQCGKLLDSLTDHLVERVSTITTSGLRQILTLLLNIPYQNDSLVEAISKCLDDRSAEVQRERRLIQVADTSQRLLQTLREVVEKDGLKSDAAETEEGHGGDHASYADTLNGLIDSAVLTVEEIQETLRNLYPFVSKRPSLDSSALVLNWCYELIQQYQRLDFKNGVLASRLDQSTGRPRAMAARSLSRLVPYAP